MMGIEKQQQNTDSEEMQEKIRVLVEHIRAAQREIENCNLEVQESKRELRALLQRQGDNWSDEQGYARLVNEGLQRFYDVEALDRLILTDPLHYGWLKDYRRERVLSERISVK